MDMVKMEREKSVSKRIGYSSVLYTTNVYKGGFNADTKVIMNDQLLCVIEESKIEEFHEALTKIVERYSLP